MGSEFRYLEDGYRGQVQADVLPNDRVAGRSRWAVWGEHDGTLPLDGRWHADGLRVSDDAWWKDFPKDSRSQNARLLPFRLEAERDLAGAWGRGLIYARALRWQVLQGSDVPVVSPYERAPQLGLQAQGRLPLAGHSLQYSVQTEINRFVLPDRDGSTTEPTGWRAHALGSLSLPWRQPGVWVVPRLSVNLASLRRTRPWPTAAPARRAPSPASASRPGWNSSVTPRCSAARCARRWSRARCTSQLRSGTRRARRTSIRRARTSISTRSSRTTRSRASTACPTRTRSPPA